MEVRTTDTFSPGGHTQAQTVNMAWVTPTSSKTGRRSYVLQRDFRVLEQEQRVTKILNSGAFRSELEGIIKSQVEGSRRPPRLSKSIQRLQDNAASGGHGQRTSSPQATSPVLPINDLRGVNASKYTLAERHLRCKLAAVYRLVDLFGWSQLIHNHITVSVHAGRSHAPFLTCLKFLPFSMSSLVGLFIGLFQIHTRSQSRASTV